MGKDTSIEWATVIVRPDNAADAASLREIILAASDYGFVPESDEDTLMEMGEYLAEDGYLCWPPADVESEAITS